MTRQLFSRHAGKPQPELRERYVQVIIIDRARTVEIPMGPCSAGQPVVIAQD